MRSDQETEFVMVSKRILNTIDSHTAGHPTRVITSGLPPLHGRTAAEKCDWFRDNLDDLRTLLLHEPRGHAAMVGAVIHESDTADYGAFFIGSYNYLPMCGHATIGIAATLDHLGLLNHSDDGSVKFDLEVPAGIVQVEARYDHGHLSSVSFENVPAYVAARDVKLENLGDPGTFDIVYGGNWYALVGAKAVGVRLDASGVHNAMAVGAALKDEVNRRIDEGAIDGAKEPVHSVLFYETDREGEELVSRQLVVLASNKFDRSPCGTGTSARLAQLLERKLIEPGERIRARNILNVDFQASATVEPGSENAACVTYRPTIEGLAHITGQHTFILQDNDPIPAGFLCR